MSFSKILLLSVGVMLVFEGLPYFLFPGAVQRLWRQLAAGDERNIRGLGFGMMLAGLLLVYLLKRQF